jgi:hypothetical protein
MTELETIGGISALAWLWAVSAAVVVALGVAEPLWPVRNLMRPTARPTGAGAAQAQLDPRFARGSRTAQDRRRRAEAGAKRA